MTESICCCANLLSIHQHSSMTECFSVCLSACAVAAWHQEQRTMYCIRQWWTREQKSGVSSLLTWHHSPANMCNQLSIWLSVMLRNANISLPLRMRGNLRYVSWKRGGIDVTALKWPKIAGKVEKQLICELENLTVVLLRMYQEWWRRKWKQCWKQEDNNWSKLDQQRPHFSRILLCQVQEYFISN